MVISKSVDDSNYVCELLNSKPINCVLIFPIIEYQDFRSFDTINIIDCNKRNEMLRFRGLEELQTSVQVLSICETFSVIMIRCFMYAILLLSGSSANNKNWNLFQKLYAQRHYCPLFNRSQEHVIKYSKESAKDFLTYRISASIFNFET
jgi:hypothetical protein